MVWIANWCKRHRLMLVLVFSFLIFLAWTIFASTRNTAGMSEYSKTMIFSVPANILTSILLGGATALAGYRVFMARMERELKKVILPVEPFGSLKELTGQIRDVVNYYEGDHSCLALVRVLPCELTPALVHRIYGHQGTKMTEALEAIRPYRDLMRKVISVGENNEGSYDVSVFGKTGFDDIDGATGNAIVADYFLQCKPDTTKLGLHSNLNEIGVILFGETKGPNSDEVRLWHYGFLVVFSANFDDVKGFKYSNHSHIATLEMIVSQREKDAEGQGGMTEFTSKMTDEEFAAIRERIEATYKTAGKSK